ncbi:MAG: MBL fold metallo-hydrolase [Planctomycetota bacterium]|nr:MBL fold metallo-hydrolase [Planctomycetota bacterium]
MTLSFSVLGSGSKGNCTLLTLSADGGERHVLVDGGLSVRATALRLAPLGVKLDQISDMLITHLDWDHFQPAWVKRIRGQNIRVHLHRRHRAIALRHGLDGRQMHLFDRPFTLGEQTSVQPVLSAHDALGTVAFVIDHGGTRLGFATDLGRVGKILLRHFVDLHALAIESNYDPELELASGRPVFLTRRIMGHAGHLSNEQSIEAVLRIAAQSALGHVVPLHLSQQCNDPRLVKDLYAARAPHLLDRLTMSHQQRPTPLLHVPGPRATAGAPRPGQQLAMFF